MILKFFEKINLLIESIRNSDRAFKRKIQIIVDAGNVLLALFIAMLLKNDSLYFINSYDFYIGCITITFPTIYIFGRLGLYRAFVRFLSIETVFLIMLGSSFSGLLLSIIKLTFGLSITFSLIVMYAILLFVIVSGIRFVIKFLIRKVGHLKKENIAIYGAGEAGARLLQILKNDNQYNTILTIDDAINKQGQFIFGVPVVSFDESIKRLKQKQIKNIFLAIPSATSEEKNAIISKLISNNFFVKSIPSLSDLVSGKTSINNFREINIEELLERDEVSPDLNLLCKNITGQTIFISGAGGSIGSEIVRQTIKLKPKKILLFDVSENATFLILEELKDYVEEHGIELLPYVGSVTDREIVKNTLKSHPVYIIFHAAAYKHVPLMEIQANQAIKNNSIGSLILAEEAIKHGVKKFILISTDKAVNPKSIMGASKRLSEHICKSLNSNQNVTTFSIVRFGNVLGSSGSVIPSFKQQIKLGGPIKITHPDVSRYFMTIKEAVELVLQSSSLAKGGEIFILDMGKSIKILDLAKKMAFLSGLTPIFNDHHSKRSKESIEIKIVGLRDGEKLHEELSYSYILKPTKHPRINYVEESTLSKDDFNRLKDSLNKIIIEDDLTGLKIILKQYASYNPD